MLRTKPAGVVTIRSSETVQRLLDALDEHGVGALVVSDDGKTVSGIVSERDVVRHLKRSGAAILTGPVSEIMTVQVITCEPADEVEGLAQIMTQQRIRHVPVTVGGDLSAIVSIGDVVKYRISALQSEKDHLLGYIKQ